MRKSIYLVLALCILSNIALQAQTIVGSIPTSLSVDENGATTCSIPIECPAGINGMQPNISLFYNSQNGNDIAGYGWAISAWSVITRTGSSRYYDGKTDGIKLTTEDNLTLDGQRLILVSGNNLEEGAKYRTESESFTDITYNDNYFTAKRKNGQIFYYRTIRNVVAADSSNITLAWLLEYTEDINGNIVYYSYQINNQTGEYSLSSIKYAANISNANISNGNSVFINDLDFKNKIEFLYSDNRPDTRVSYVAGFKITKSKLLSEINTYSNNTLQRKYNMTYDYDGYYKKLKQISLTSSDGSQLKPTVIDWGNTNTATLQDKSYNVASNTESSDKIFFCDIDNDGNNEVIKPKKAVINNRFVHDAKCVVYKINKTTNTLNIISEFNNYEFPELNPSDIIDKDINVLQSDINNDGLNDIVVCRGEERQDNKWYYIIFFRMASGAHFSYSLPPLDVKPNIMLGDFYPDGKTDIIINNTVYDIDLSMEAIDIKLNLEFMPVEGRTTDMNGNGLTELWSNDAIYEYDRNTHKYIIIPFPYTEGETGDFNGDGKTDILQYSGNQWHLFISTGKNLVETLCPITRNRNFDHFDPNIYFDSYIVSDFNGDGYDDIAEFYKTDTVKHQNVYYSTGNGFTKIQYPVASSIDNLYNSTQSTEKYRTIADLDGDGINEIISFDRTGFSYASIKSTESSQRLHSVTNGMGVKQSVNYSLLTDGVCYTRGDDDGPIDAVRIVIPMYVTDKLTVDYGNETYSTDYKYEGLLYHKAGKGLLGFERQKEINAQTGAYSLSMNEVNTLYSFLYTASKTMYAPDGNIVATFTYEYTIKDLGGKRFFPYVYKQVKTDNLKNITVILQNDQLDDYGNVTENTTVQGGVTTRVKTYYGVHGSWCKNLPDSIVTTVDDGVETYRRSSIFTYDVLGRITKSISDPGNPHSITTEYKNYDVLGHPLTVQITAADQNGTAVTRTESKTYTLSGRFILTSTDALNQTTTFNTDENTGLLTSSTNAANQTTTLEYDSFGNLVKTTLPDGNYTMNHNEWSDGSVSSAVFRSVSQSSGSAPVTLWYDGMGREILKETVGFNNKAVRIKKEYYSQGTHQGALMKISESYFTTGSPTAWAAEYTYDIHNRVTSLATPNGTTSTVYNGRAITVTSPQGTATSVDNELGQTESVTTNGKKVSYTYYINGQLKSATPEGGQAVTMQYDLQGKRVKLYDPDQGWIVNKYDGFGQMVRQSQRVHAGTDSVITSCLYSPQGLLQSYTCGTSTTNYTYDSRNGYKTLVTEVEIPDVHSCIYTYDPYGRPLTETHHAAGRTFTFGVNYDNAGRIQRKTYPTGYYTAMQYDANGYLTQVTDEAGRNLYHPVETDEKGRLTSLLRGNITTALAFDAQGHNTSINAPGVMDYTYTYNTAGDMQSRSDGITNQQEIFTHDSRHRLTNWDIYKNNAMIKSNGQTYDDLTGNISSRSGINNFTMNYLELQGKPHALSGINGVTAGFPALDVNVSYTDFKKMQHLEEGDKTYDITYGIGEQRISSVYTQAGAVKERRIYLGDYEEVTDADGSTRKIHYLSGGAVYIQTMGASSLTDTLYYAYTDNQGSLIALTDENGNVVEKYAYDPWGARRNPDYWTLAATPPSGGWGAINRGYTGHEHLDAFGIINMNGRVYDPLTAQFFSPDPVLEAGNWLNYNRYLYCNGNPLTFTDPSGYQKKVCDSDREELRSFPNDFPDGLLDFFLRNACSHGGSGMNLGPSVFSPYRWITGNVYLNTDGEVVSYAEVYNNYILPNGTNFTGQSASAVFEKMSDGYNIYHITYKPGNIDAYVFANGDIGTVTPDACGALYISNPFAGMMAGVNASMFAGGDSQNSPEWMKNTSIGAGAFGIGIGAQNELWDFAVRTSYKSARTWGEFRALKPTQQAFRYSQTLGKTGTTFLKTTKVLGYAGAAISTGIVAYGSVNYYLNGGTDWTVGAKAGLDVVMTGVGFFGPIGFSVSAIYFFIDTTTGGFGGFGDPNK